MHRIDGPLMFVRTLFYGAALLLVLVGCGLKTGGADEENANRQRLAHLIEQYQCHAGDRKTGEGFAIVNNPTATGGVRYEHRTGRSARDANLTVEAWCKK